MVSIDGIKKLGKNSLPGLHCSPTCRFKDSVKMFITSSFNHPLELPHLANKDRPFMLTCNILLFFVKESIDKKRYPFSSFDK